MLAEAQAKELKLKLVTAEKAPDWLPFRAGGIVIPYFDLAGKVTEFSRFRYLEQPQRNGFDALVAYKELRYAQRSGSANELYLPPIAPWSKIAKTIDVPIIITEGELKAACTMLHTEYACIGLGGVWCFRSTRNNMSLLPQFKQISWQGRQVYIIFDSDAATNVDVMKAESALAHELTRLGAVVKIGRIPTHKSGKKQGLDDYLLANGAEAIGGLVEAAVSFKENVELFRMNEEVVYVRDPGFIYRISNGQRLAPRAFVDHAFSTRQYTVKTESDKGVKLETRSTAKEWLKWPPRSEASRLTYRPGEARSLPNGELNLWRGWGCEPKKGDVSLWKHLLDHLFGADKDARTWLERWLACPLQQPGIKLYTCPLVWGRQHGTGKSWVGYSLFKIYGDNATEIKNKDIHSDHNEWAENRSFVMGSEISGSDKRQENDELKNMITQEFLRINVKYVPSFVVPDCINYYLTSNRPDALFLDDEDRRGFIHEVLAGRLPLDFCREYEAWIGAPGTVGPGASALFYHLLHLPLGDFNPRGPAPDTVAKRDMISIGRSDIATWVDMLKNDPDSILRFDGTPIKHALWTSDDLLRLYDPEGRGKVTVNGMTRALRSAGFRQAYNGQSVPTKAGHKRLWILRQLPARYHNVKGELLGEFYDTERALPTRKEKHK